VKKTEDFVHQSNRAKAQERRQQKLRKDRYSNYIETGKKHSKIEFRFDDCDYEER
jgi:hypothetical protein